jgi:hypothetical protein
MYKCISIYMHVSLSLYTYIYILICIHTYIFINKYEYTSIWWPLWCVTMACEDIRCLHVPQYRTQSWLGIFGHASFGSLWMRGSPRCLISWSVITSCLDVSTLNLWSWWWNSQRVEEQSEHHEKLRTSS